jgi:protein TonB
MPETSMQSGSTTSKTERRAHSRQKIQSLTYVELGNGNGGIALNVSEGGMTVVAAQPLDAEGSIDIALQLPQTRKRLQVKGEIRWLSESRKEAGLQFIDLSAEALEDIRAWMTREASPEPLDESIYNMSGARQPRSMDDGASFFAEEEVDEAAVEQAATSVTPSADAEDSSALGAKLERVFEEGHPASETAHGGAVESEEEIVLEPLVNNPPLESAPPAEAAPLALASGSAAPQDGRVTNKSSRRTPFSTLASEMSPAKASDPAPANPIEELLEPEPESQPFSPATNLASPRPSVSSAPRPLELSRPLLGASYRSEESPEHGEKDIRVHLQSNWVLALLMLMLALISFFSGIAVRRGVLNRVLGEGESNVGARPVPAIIPGESTPAQPSEAVAASTAAAQKRVDIEIVDSSNRKWTIPMAPGGVVTTPAQNPVMTATAAPAPSTATSQETRPPVSATNPPAGTAPANPSLNTKTTSNTDLSDATTTDDGSGGLMLTLPETPVAASSLVAISARRFIPIPREAAARNRNLQVGSLENLVEPVYPPEAMQQGVEGTVKLRGTISPDGSMQFLDAESGPKALMPATLTAVRNWRYNPTLLNGKPIETQEEVTVVFRLPR